MTIPIIERSMSIHKKILTPERSLLSNAKLNGLRRVMLSDFMEMYFSANNHEHDNLRSWILQELPGKARREKSQTELIHRKMDAEEKDQKDYRERMKKNEERKRTLSQTETEVKSNEKQLQESINYANSVFEETNTRLTHIIKEKNLSEINITQGLLEVPTKHLEQARAAMEKCSKQNDDTLNQF